MTFGRRSSRETAPPPIPALPDEYREPSPIPAADPAPAERRTLTLNRPARKAIERILALSPGASIVLSGYECKAIRDSLQSG